MARYTIKAAGYIRALRELMADTATTAIAPEYLNDDGTYPMPDAPFSWKNDPEYASNDPDDDDYVPDMTDEDIIQQSIKNLEESS